MGRNAVQFPSGCADTAKVTDFGIRGGAHRRPAEVVSQSQYTAVTSRRLDRGTPVSSRYFPKIRSWFALGAPLELLSPLSVIRVVLPLVAVAWPCAALVGRWPDSRMEMVVGATATVGVLWFGLLFVRRIGSGTSHFLAAGVVMLGGLVLLAGSGRGFATAMVPTLVLVTVFVALFLSGRAVAAHQMLIAMVLFAVEMLVSGWGTALSVAMGATVSSSAVAGTVWLLVASAGRSGTVDPDTGLPNAAGVARRLEAWDATTPILIAVVSLGGLSDARDALGYRVATDLLRRAVEDFGQVIPNEAVIGRIGDDELAVVLQAAGKLDQRKPAGRAGPGSEHVEAVRRGGADLAALLARTIAAGHYLVGPVEVALRGHVGTTVGPWDGSNVPELIRRAALSAKAAGSTGESTSTWDGTDATLSAEDLALLSDLRLAGDRGELWIAFQPQVGSVSGRIEAVEALLRWQSPVHGPVPPGRFIPLAERTGLVDRLTDWVFVAALDAAARFYRLGLHIPVSVNLSARTVGKPGLADWILSELVSRQLPPAMLTVEVTETAAVDLLQAVRLLGPLHENGVRVSMDDFGTGYTSLAALPQLPLDELKVDMSFVRRSATSPADEAIVRSVRELAHRLGLVAVAEGVEDEALSRAMTAIGYDLLQGYHFSRPVPEDQLLRLLEAEAGLVTAT